MMIDLYTTDAFALVSCMKIDLINRTYLCIFVCDKTDDNDYFWQLDAFCFMSNVLMKMLLFYKLMQ